VILLTFSHDYRKIGQSLCPSLVGSYRGPTHLSPITAQSTAEDLILGFQILPEFTRKKEYLVLSVQYSFCTPVTQLSSQSSWFLSLRSRERNHSQGRRCSELFAFDIVTARMGLLSRGPERGRTGTGCKDQSLIPLQRVKMSASAESLSRTCTREPVASDLFLKLDLFWS
jgi:hypothetical protein